MDWKDALLNYSRDNGLESVPEPEREPQGLVEKSAKPSETLHIAREKKGRAGKTALIVYGFECGDTELRRVAATLKQALGCGGSARGGEILIQGDCEPRLREQLKKLGYKLK